MCYDVKGAVLTFAQLLNQYSLGRACEVSICGFISNLWVLLILVLYNGGISCLYIVKFIISVYNVGYIVIVLSYISGFNTKS